MILVLLTNANLYNYESIGSKFIFDVVHFMDIAAQNAKSLFIFIGTNILNGD